MLTKKHKIELDSNAQFYYENFISNVFQVASPTNPKMT